MNEYENLIKKSKDLISKYENHFNVDFPHNIFWWEPLNIYDHIDELKSGLTEMEKDIESSIRTNIPLKETTKDLSIEIVY